MSRLASRRRLGLEDVHLIGYILPENKVIRAEDADSDSGDEEEEREPEFLDMKEMLSVSSGGHLFNSSIPPRGVVDFKDLSGKTHRVEGRFALRDPWWEASCLVGGHREDVKILRRYPSFKLRSDLDREGWRSIVSLFLKACGVTEEEFITQFFEWLPADKDISFSNLLEVLTEFEDAPQNKAVAQHIKAKVADSAAGKRVKAASLYPLVMRYLPTLLPAHFTDLLGKGKGKGSNGLPGTQPWTQTTCQEEEERLTLLARLEEIIRTDAWKLGFNYVMYKELKLVRCEATLTAINDCKPSLDIPLPQLSALRVYDRLKDHCRRRGSTYMTITELCKDLDRSVHLADEGVWNAVQLLIELGVVKRVSQKVAIRNMYSYETGIAKCLRSLVEGEPWHIPLDAREVLRAAEEERIRRREGGAREVPDPDGEGDSGAVQANNMDGNTADIDPGRPNDSRSAHTGAEPDSSDTARATHDAGPPAADHNQIHVKLDPDQVRAAEMICANPVTVISGKGGCGKTTVVSLVFKAAMEQQKEQQKEEVMNACRDFENDTGGSESWGNPVLWEEEEEEEEKEKKKKEKEKEKEEEDGREVLLTAPTGRAAALLSKKTCFTAYTLHQVLWSFMTVKKDETGSPENWKFESVRVLVVDEGSLVCVQLLNSVLTMLTRHAQLQKFIILGDVRQLPSIQPGNVLHDLFHSVRLNNWAIEMKTNHRAESELIVKNAGLISFMGMNRRVSQLEFDAILDMRKGEVPTMPSADKSFILVLLPNDDLYNAVSCLLKAAPGLEKDTASQFITFKRMDCALINDACCKHYSNHRTKNHKNKVVFQPGDKVCCTKNGYVTDQDEQSFAGKSGEDGDRLAHMSMMGSPGKTKKEKEKNLRLCNGEIFFISEDVTKPEEDGRRRVSRYLTLDDRDGRVLKLSYRELQRECRLQHAWARTIHTFQGSETETIVYVLGNSNAETWKHVYTAVTRGQKRVYVVAVEGGMKSAIGRSGVPRHTRLEGLVKELLVKPGLKGQPDSSQAQSDTPRRAAPGFGPAPSTPLSPPTPSCSRVPFAQSTPFQPKCLWKDEAPAVTEVNATCVTLHDDDITSEDRRPADDGHLSDAPAAPPAVSPGTKRTLSPTDSDTPNKQLKVEPFESPLACTILQQLSIRTPQGKWLQRSSTD